MIDFLYIRKVIIYNMILYFNKPRYINNNYTPQPLYLNITIVMMLPVTLNLCS